MRLLAISVLVFSGVLCAGIGTIAEAIPGARFRNELDNWGIALALLATFMFVMEWWLTREKLP